MEQGVLEYDDLTALRTNKRGRVGELALFLAQCLEAIAEPLVELTLKLSQGAARACEIEADCGGEMQHQFGLSPQQRRETGARQHPQPKRRYCCDGSGARCIRDERELAENRGRMHELECGACDSPLGRAFAQHVQCVVSSGFEYRSARASQRPRARGDLVEINRAVPDSSPQPSHLGLSKLSLYFIDLHGAMFDATRADPASLVSLAYWRLAPDVAGNSSARARYKLDALFIEALRPLRASQPHDFGMHTLIAAGGVPEVAIIP